MAKNQLIHGGGETKHWFHDPRSTLTAVGQRFDKWVRDNPETMDRWRAAVSVIKAELIDDLAAEDGSEVRAALFNPEDLQTVIQHGWYPPPDCALAQLRLWADAFRDPDHKRSESARQLGFMLFRRDAQKIERALVKQFPHRKRILRKPSMHTSTSNTFRRLRCFSRRPTGSARTKSATISLVAGPLPMPTMSRKASSGNCSRG